LLVLKFNVRPLTVTMLTSELRKELFVILASMKELVKLVVFVPEENTDKVRDALGRAGAGKIGEYSFCSYSVKGIGRFKPSDNANPHIGSAGQLEAVDEERIEVACEKDQASEIIKVIKEVHPYEEVVIDVYPMLSL
jgi:hypothetical protein